MYRKPIHYIIGVFVVMAYLLLLPNSRTGIAEWIQHGWYDDWKYWTAKFESTKDAAQSFNRAMVAGEAKNTKWQVTDNWVRFITPGATYRKVYPITITKWIDGDTVDVIYNRKEYRIRLADVDTFETSMNQKMRKDAQEYGKSPAFLKRLGEAGKRFVAKLLPPQSSAGISFTSERPQYGKHRRLIGYIHTTDGKVINELLVREGIARVWAINSKNSLVYKGLETKAKVQHKGIWKYLNQN